MTTAARLIPFFSKAENWRDSVPPKGTGSPFAINRRSRHPTSSATNRHSDRPPADVSGRLNRNIVALAQNVGKAPAKKSIRLGDRDESPFVEQRAPSRPEVPADDSSGKGRALPRTPYPGSSRPTALRRNGVTAKWIRKCSVARYVFHGGGLTTHSVHHPLAR